MVSAMTATTASVSPSCQETRIENATMTMTATTIRSRQTRILGLADRWARLPRRWPMPGDRAPAPASSTGVTTGFHSGLGGSAASAAGWLLLTGGLRGRGPVPQRQVRRFRLGRRTSRRRDLGRRDSAAGTSAAGTPAAGTSAAGTSAAGPRPPLSRPWPAPARSPAHPVPVPPAREPNFPTHPQVPLPATVPRRVLPRCACLPSSAPLMTCFSASATPSGITHHLSVTAIGLCA